MSTPADEEFVRGTFFGLLETQNYPNYHYHSILKGQRPPVETSGAVCVVASSHSSYIQKPDEAENHLLTLCKLCRDLAKPLPVLVALDTLTTKTLRRISAASADLRSVKILLWDTKSFWPSWRSMFPSPPMAVSPKPSMAVNHKDEDEAWTYVKSNNHGSGDSSLSTQSTDTMMASTKLSSAARRLSSQPPGRQFNSMMSRPRLTHAGLGPRHQQQRGRVIENPLACHHRSQQQQQQDQQHRCRPPEDPDEPIYHSLDDDDVVVAGRRPSQVASVGGEDSEADVTVYINADLEVVYPTLNDGGGKDFVDDDDEAELNGLLADCYENEELHGYVPSPAPGSYPRAHISYTGAAASLQRQQQQPRHFHHQFQPQAGTREPGYLV